MCIKIGLTTFETIVMEMPPKKKKLDLVLFLHGGS